MSEVLYRKYRPDLSIIFTAHAKESMRKRGAISEEVEKVIRTAPWTEGRQGRFEAKLEFPYNSAWNNVFYQTKQVNPVFVVEHDKYIVVITVYVFYF